MKPLFNLDVIDGDRSKAHPTDDLRSLPRERRTPEVREFLQWPGHEAETGVVTAREFPAQPEQPAICTGRPARSRDHG